MRSLKGEYECMLFTESTSTCTTFYTHSIVTSIEQLLIFNILSTKHSLERKYLTSTCIYPPIQNIGSRNNIPWLMVLNVTRPRLISHWFHFWLITSGITMGISSEPLSSHFVAAQNSRRLSAIPQTPVEIIIGTHSRLRYERTVFEKLLWNLYLLCAQRSSSFSFRIHSGYQY